MRIHKSAAVLLTGFLLCTGMTAYADDYAGADGWKASFDGSSINTNFTAGGLTEEAGSIQPGDSITLKVTAENKSDAGSEWYMSNEVLKSMEEGGPAHGGAYSYKVSWKTGGTEKVLFESSRIGGEGDTQGYLKGATDGLDEFFYLDHLDSGQSGLISIKVSLNGEAQVNTYQDALAKLSLDFAVEASENRNTSGNSGGTTENKPTGNVKPVKTGDDAQIALWGLLTACSGLGVISIVFLIHRKGKGELRQ